LQRQSSLINMGTTVTRVYSRNMVWMHCPGAIAHIFRLPTNILNVSDGKVFITEHPISPQISMQLLSLFRAKDEMSEDIAGYLQEVPEEIILDTRDIQLLDSVGQGNLNPNSFLAYCL